MPEDVFRLLAADMDGDGDVDLVGSFPPFYPENDGITLLRNNGDATFEATSMPMPGIGYFLEVMDMDGDGDPDLVAAEQDLDVVYVLLNQGDGTLASGGRFAANLPSSRRSGQVTGLALGETDGDGDADVVTVRSAGGMGGVAFNRGDGTLAAPTRVPFGAFGESVGGLVLTDLDNDGFEDFVVATPDGGWPRVFFFEQPGAYVPGPALGGFSGRSSVTMGDFNGDGLVDLVVGEKNLFVNVLLNRGDRTFEVGPDVRADGAFLAAGDLNADGLLDLVAGDGRFLDVFLGDGAGGLVPHGSIDTGSPAAAMVLQDADGDGSLDVLLARFDSVHALYNDGTGTLGEPTLVAETGTPDAFASGDINGDGLDDLAVLGREEVLVLVARDTGGLVLDRRYFVEGLGGFEDASGAIADLNGDGAGDLVLPLAGGRTAVMLNHGDGRLAPPQTVIADALESSLIEVADMDGNGTNDIVTTDASPGRSGVEVTILLNRCRPAECPADLDGDGELTVYDFLALQNAFDAGCP